MPTEMEQLIERIAERVKAEMSAKQTMSVVAPLPEVRGTWQDQAALDQYLGGADRVGTDGNTPDVPSNEVARRIDHTLLKADATRADHVKLCEEAAKYRFASVCINTTWVVLCKQLLKGTGVMTICVVGFPLGAATSRAKAAETREAIANGADEIDMVINLGLLKSGDHNAVFDDIKQVVDAASGRPVKVILETHLLNREQKIASCALSKAAGAAFVKTATGFSGGGATVEDIRLMRQVVGPDMGVKASGGVRSAADAQAMLGAGATRLGASASVAIVTGGTGKGAY
ncbi:deoxyribose-phosphate aldolase [Deltaproteobacteria bacterium]|nr:deoxyribose-phosphate aldolase [Deltaproteobacteria bacterium]